MLKTSAFLICLLFVGSIGTSKADPLDTPDVVYIDGQPCNQACQSYMAWSRSVSGRPVPVAPAPQMPSAEVRPAAKNTLKQAAPDRRVAGKNAAKRDAARPLPDAKLARTDRTGARPAAPRIAAMPPTRSEPATAVEPAKTIPPAQDLTGTITDAKPATAPDAPSTTGTATATGPDASAPAAQSQTAAVPPSETPPDQAAAPPPREEKTQEATTQGQKPEQAAGAAPAPSNAAKATSPDNARTAAAAPTAADPLVAVLLVRKEIKSVADLANKVVAIDASDTVSRTKTAIVSAGGADVQLSEGARMALLRVMDGEVQAAVVTLESPQKAAVWQEVPGFNVLRVPLGPEPGKDGPG
jgi:hypothetical protein